MDISYVLIIIFMVLILIFGIIGIVSPGITISYYLKYTKSHPKIIKVTNKRWFYVSLKISSVLLIVYSIAVLFLITRKMLL